MPTGPAGPAGVDTETGDPGGIGAPVPVGAAEPGLPGPAGTELSGELGEPLAGGAEADGATVTVLTMVTGGGQVGQVGQADGLATTGTDEADSGDTGTTAERAGVTDTTGADDASIGDCIGISMFDPFPGVQSTHVRSRGSCDDCRGAVDRSHGAGGTRWAALYLRSTAGDDDLLGAVGSVGLLNGDDWCYRSCLDLKLSITYLADWLHGSQNSASRECGEGE